MVGVGHSDTEGIYTAWFSRVKLVSAHSLGKLSGY